MSCMGNAAARWMNLEPSRPVAVYVGGIVKRRVVLVVELLLPAISSPDRDPVLLHCGLYRRRHHDDWVAQVPCQGCVPVDRERKMSARPRHSGELLKPAILRPSVKVR